jgi:hypothetical protein
MDAMRLPDRVDPDLPHPGLGEHGSTPLAAETPEPPMREIVPT